MALEQTSGQWTAERQLESYKEHYRSGVHVPPSSWWVCPPLCGEEWLVRELKQFFGEFEGEVRLAHVAADASASVKDFIDRVRSEWDVGHQGKRPVPASHLVDFVRQVASSGQRPILLLSEFHKIADWVEGALLGKMRELMEEGSLEVAVIAPLDWDSLLNWLERKGIYLMTSRFGTSCSPHVLALRDPAAMKSQYLDAGGEEHEWPMVQRLTGGMPGLVELASTLRRKAGGLEDPDSRWSYVSELRSACLGGMQRLFRYLDEPGSKSRAVEVGKLHLGHEASIAALRQHNWGRVLLNEDNQLRSECVGEGAIRALGMAPQIIKLELLQRLHKRLQIWLLETVAECSQQCLEALRLALRLVQLKAAYTAQAMAML